MKEGVIVVAAFMVILVGGLYLVEHWPTVNCFNWFGLAKGCVITR